MVLTASPSVSRAIFKIGNPNAIKFSSCISDVRREFADVNLTAIKKSKHLTGLIDGFLHNQRAKP